MYKEELLMPFDRSRCRGVIYKACGQDELSLYKEYDHERMLKLREFLIDLLYFTTLT